MKNVEAVEKRFVEVLLPLKLDRPLTYRLPDGWEAEPGTWVQVPLRGHLSLGVVEQLRGSVPAGVNPSAVGQVAAVLDKPAVPAGTLAFWHAVADYYLCTPGEVFKAAWNTALQRQLLLREKPVRARHKAQAGDEGRLNPLSEHLELRN